MSLELVQLPRGVPLAVLDSAVLAVALEAGEQAAHVRFQLGETEIVLPEFAARLARVGGEWRPAFDACFVSSRLIVVGLHALAAFDLERSELTCFARLFRPKDMDLGWLSVTMVRPSENRSVVVYESGVLALDECDRVLWHRPKGWDDHFVEVVDSNLSFLSDDASFMISADDGSLW